MICPDCGYELRDTAKFCVNCGTKVTVGNTAAAPADENQQQKQPVKETQSIFGIGAVGDETEMLPVENVGFDRTEILPEDSDDTEILSQSGGNTDILPKQAAGAAYTVAAAATASIRKEKSPSPRKFRSSDKKLGSAISGIFSFLVIIAALSVGALLYITNNPEIKTGYYLNKAEGEYLAGNYEEALQVYDKVITIDSENPRSYIGIAKVYRADGEKEKAIDALYEGYRETGSENIWTMIKRYSEE
ncbi:MAG: zinc-ribbon domain-containing protein [Ruminiclostridium sp.]